MTSNVRIDPKWSGVVTVDGVLKLDARGLFHAHLARLKNQAVEVIVRQLRRPKSSSQLGYLWGVVYPIAAEHFGYTRMELDALHDACMRHVIGLKPDPNPLQVRASLAELSHADVSDYISDLRFWLVQEHGCVTPDATMVETRKADTQ